MAIECINAASCSPFSIPAASLVQIAELLGYKNWSAFQQEVLMAKTPSRVRHALNACATGMQMMHVLLQWHPRSRRGTCSSASECQNREASSFEPIAVEVLRAGSHLFDRPGDQDEAPNGCRYQEVDGGELSVQQHLGDPAFNATLFHFMAFYMRLLPNKMTWSTF